MRFPILRQTCRIRKKNVSTIVMGTAILHNIFNSLGMELPVIDADEESEQVEEGGNWDGEMETDTVREVMVDLVATL